MNAGSYVGPSEAAVRKVALEAASRPQGRIPLRVVGNDIPQGGSDYHFGLFGLAPVFVYPEGSPFEDRLDEALQNGHIARDVASWALAQMASQSVVGQDAKAELAVRAGVIADLEYLGQTLFRHIFVTDELPVFMTTLPYNGGRTVDDGFVLRTYAHTDVEPLRGTIVLTAPQLTDAERAMLERVPEDALAVNVGDPSIWCRETSVAFATALTAAAIIGVAACPASVAVTAAACPGVAATAYTAAHGGGLAADAPPLLRTYLTQDSIDALGAVGTAQKLIDSVAASLLNPASRS